MLLRLLRLCGAKEALLAGADGYRPGARAYADSSLHAHTDRGAELQRPGGRGHAQHCRRGLPLRFLTPSEYEREGAV